MQAKMASGGWVAGLALFLVVVVIIVLIILVIIFFVNRGTLLWTGGSVASGQNPSLSPTGYQVWVITDSNTRSVTITQPGGDFIQRPFFLVNETSNDIIIQPGSGVVFRPSGSLVPINNNNAGTWTLAALTTMTLFWLNDTTLYLIQSTSAYPIASPSNQLVVSNM